MRRIVLAALTPAFLAIACQPTTAVLTEEQRSAIGDALTGAFNDYAVAIRQLDQERVLAFFQNSAESTLAEYGQITRSWSAIAQVVREAWPFYASVQRFEWGDLHIQALAPHVAVVTTTFDFAAADTTGAPIAANGTFSSVWVSTSGQWKIVNLAETFPTAETSAEQT